MAWLAEKLSAFIWQMFGETRHKKGGWGCLFAAGLAPVLLLCGFIYLISLML